MNETWKGFAGLVVVLFLAYYVTRMDSEEAEENRIVFETEPIQFAETAFQKEDYVFYRIWSTRADEDGKIYAFWLLKGEQNITPNLLTNYPKRYDFKKTHNNQLTHEQNHFHRKASNWSLQYNLRLAELLATTPPPHE